MIETPLPLVRLVDNAAGSRLTLLLEQLATLRLENVTLRAENSVRHERVQELDARLGKTSANSSRPPRPTHRSAVLWRKASFGSDSEAGGRFAERPVTMLASCRQQGRRVHDFVMAAGEAALQVNLPPSLLPALRPG
jgi:hypothetical protein